MTTVNPHLIIWDFDHSLIDDNSDTWIPAKLDSTGCCDQIIRDGRLLKKQWTTIMIEVVTKLHLYGVTPSQIIETAGKLPIFDGVIETILECHSKGITQYILSDANLIYINSFLIANGIAHCFDGRVITNFAEFDAHGCLIIKAHQEHYRGEIYHGCTLCPPNLCKGGVVDELSISTASKVIYIGDGLGDLCPSLRLRHGDTVLARENFSLIKAIRSLDYKKEKLNCLADVHTWSNGFELRNKILSLVSNV